MESIIKGILNKAKVLGLNIKNLGTNSQGNIVIIVENITKDFIDSLGLEFKLNNYFEFEAKELEAIGAFVSYRVEYLAGSDTIRFDKDTYLRIELVNVDFSEFEIN